MANPAIPVPEDLVFTRTGDETGALSFTSVDDTYLYDVRMSYVPEFWNEIWSAQVGPYPAGTPLRLDLTFPTTLVVTLPGEPAPPAPTGELYFFITAKDPAAVTDPFSFIFPPPEGVPLADSGNYGQGGLKYVVVPYVETVPDPPVPPPPPPEPVPDPEPPPIVVPVPDATEKPVLTVANGSRHEMVKVSPWVRIPGWGLFGVWISKETP